ncbi:MAG: peptidylprolyl isomerase [Betaproteobacteria bacterium]|nr:peptidylprolyl isomerase [Betaproteobacteria bacterium]
MLIARNTVVSLEVEISDLWGKLIERSDEAVQYLHGGYGNVFAPIEAALEGKAQNDSVRLRLEPVEAFGDYDENLLRVEPRSRYPDSLESGMKFEGESGTDDAGLIFVVSDMAEDKVVLDGNHPLAGMALEFSCKVVGIRWATAAEIANGSADGEGSVIMRVIP